MTNEMKYAVTVICANEMTYKAIMHCDDPLNQRTAKDYYFHFWKENGKIYVWLIPVGFTPEYWQMKLKAEIVASDAQRSVVSDAGGDDE